MKYEYKGFVIVRWKPSRRISWRTHRCDKYMATSTLLRDAKNLIDFNLRHGVWK